MKKPIITIDGPAGSGKTTVSKLIANYYNLIWVDTGALYRGVALISKQKGVAPDDIKGLEQLFQSLKLNFIRKEGKLLLYNHENDISDEIRSPEISMLASSISAQPVVRKYLLDVQRQLGKQGAVLEGRDMGTVVFPNADIKFYLFADHTVRAKRRFKELQEKSIEASFEKLSKEIEQRDLQDQNREIAPLKPAEDAIKIDCSEMDINEVEIKMREYIDQKFLSLNND